MTPARLITDEHVLIGAATGQQHGSARYPTRVWDNGFGKLWVYRETLGVLGIVRADSFENAWSCVVDEILDDADPDDPDTYARSYDADADEYELAECCHWRGSGAPSNPKLTSGIAREDSNGSRLDELTAELATELGVVVCVELWGPWGEGE